MVAILLFHRLHAYLSGATSCNMFSLANIHWLHNYSGIYPPTHYYNFFLVFIRELQDFIEPVQLGLAKSSIKLYKPRFFESCNEEGG